MKGNRETEQISHWHSLLHRRPFLSLYWAKPQTHPLTFSTWRWWRWCRGYHCRQRAARLRCQRRDSLSSLWLKRHPRVWTLVSPPTLSDGGDRLARVGMQSFQPAFLCLLIGLWRRIVGDRQTSLASPRPAWNGARNSSASWPNPRHRAGWCL